MSDQPTSSNPGSGVGVKGGPKTVPSRMKKILPGGKTAAFALGMGGGVGIYALYDGKLEREKRQRQQWNLAANNPAANPNYQGSLASSGFASNPLYLPSYGSNVNTGSTNSGWSSPSSSYYKRDVVDERPVVLEKRTVTAEPPRSLPKRAVLWKREQDTHTPDLVKRRISPIWSIVGVISSGLLYWEAKGIWKSTHKVIPEYGPNVDPNLQIQQLTRMGVAVDPKTHEVKYPSRDY